MASKELSSLGEEVIFEQSTIRCGADGQWTERPGYDHATQEEYESEDRDYPGEKPKTVRKLLKDSVAAVNVLQADPTLAARFRQALHNSHVSVPTIDSESS